jgi:26S proteasome regulatory subunit T1
MTDNSKKPE